MSDSPAPVPEEQPPAAPAADGCPEGGCPDGTHGTGPADGCSDGVCGAGPADGCGACETGPAESRADGGRGAGPADGCAEGARGAGPEPGAGGGGAHPTVAVVNRVLSDLASLTGASLWALSDVEALGVLDGMDTALRLAHAVQLAAVREVDGRNLAAAEGAPSTAAYLRGMLKMRPRDAHQAVGLASDLDSTYVATGEQLAAARINVDQAGVIARALNRLPAAIPAEGVGVAERILLEAAEILDAADLARLGESMRLAALDDLRPGGPEGEGDEDPSRQRELTLSDESDGTTRIRGRLDAEAATALRSALDALSKPRPTVAGAPDLRTAARRRADALVEITTRVLTSGTLPLTGGVRPQITVSVTVDTLAGRPGSPAALTSWGLPLPYATLVRLCCDPSIARVILNADGVPLDLGRTERLVTPDLRRALVERDKGCTFPQCDRPAAWTEAHHVVHWKDGGATTLDNLTLVCVFHHGVVHHQGWTIQMGSDRRPEYIPPAYLDPDQRPRRNLLRTNYPDLLAGIVPTRRNPRDDTPPTPAHPPGGDPPPQGSPPAGSPAAASPAGGAATGMKPKPPGHEPAGHGPPGNEPPVGRPPDQRSGEPPPHEHPPDTTP